MASLAQLPELVGFFSYSREDDEAFRGSLSALRDAIQRELSAQLGRRGRLARLRASHRALLRQDRRDSARALALAGRTPPVGGRGQKAGRGRGARSAGSRSEATGRGARKAAQGGPGEEA